MGTPQAPKARWTKAAIAERKEQFTPVITINITQPFAEADKDAEVLSFLYKVQTWKAMQQIRLSVPEPAPIREDTPENKLVASKARIKRANVINGVLLVKGLREAGELEGYEGTDEQVFEALSEDMPPYIIGALIDKVSDLVFGKPSNVSEGIFQG